MAMQMHDRGCASHHTSVTVELSAAADVAGRSSFRRWSRHAVSLTVANRVSHEDHERQQKPCQLSCVQSFVAVVESQAKCLISVQFKTVRIHPTINVVDAVQKSSSRRKSIGSHRCKKAFRKNFLNILNVTFIF